MNDFLEEFKLNDRAIYFRYLDVESSLEKILLILIKDSKHVELRSNSNKINLLIGKSATSFVEKIKKVNLLAIKDNLNEEILDGEICEYFERDKASISGVTFYINKKNIKMYKKFIKHIKTYL